MNDDSKEPTGHRSSDFVTNSSRNSAGRKAEISRSKEALNISEDPNDIPKGNNCGSDLEVL